MTNISITSYSAICNLGTNIKEIFQNAVLSEQKFFTKDDGIIKDTPFYFGKIHADLPEIKDKEFNTRTNTLLLHCANQLKDEITEVKKKYGEKRIAVVIGTTNSGVDEYEKSKNVVHSQIGLPAIFLKQHLGLKNYCTGVSTACTSGLKAFSTAIKLIQNGVCDAAICGSTDALSKTPVFGFNSLEVESHKKCIPFSSNRDGINIGEGAALFILEKDIENGIKILGLGETSDAYHAATPDPEGIQATFAIEQALKEANLKADDIDYINLHGTGTITNDLMEANAVYRVFKDSVPCSSTKSLTGHCLGASAGVETALCIALIDETINESKLLLPHCYDNCYDTSLPEIRLVKENETAPKIDIVMCNAFGFGGSNAVMILGKTAPNIKNREKRNKNGK